MFFFSMRALAALEPTWPDTPDAVVDLYTTGASEIFHAIDHLTQNLKVGSYATSESIPNALSECVEYIHEASRYSTRSTSDKADKVMKSLMDLPGIDAGLFVHDEEYRKEALVALARSSDEFGALQKAFTVSVQLGVDPSVLATERIMWMAETDSVDGTLLLHAMEELGEYIIVNDAISKLQANHTVVSSPALNLWLKSLKFVR
jgi:hypothetical protein